MCAEKKVQRDGFFLKEGKWEDVIHFSVQAFGVDQGWAGAADQEPNPFDCGQAWPDSA